MEKDAAGCRAFNRNYIVGGKYFIPKECAIKYLASAAMCRNPQQSYRYKLFVTEFRKQYNIKS